MHKWANPQKTMKIYVIDSNNPVNMLFVGQSWINTFFLWLLQDMVCHYRPFMEIPLFNYLQQYHIIGPRLVMKVSIYQ